MQSQAANMVFSLDASMYASALTEMFTQILELCQQYMPERVYTLVVGQDGVQPLNIARDEIQGKYHIFCRGNDINSNPQLRAQKAFMRVQTLLNPQTMQIGVVTPMNAFEILKNFLQADGELAWQAMLTPPQPPPPPPPPVQIMMDNLTDAEQSQVLQRNGIEPDPLGRSVRRRVEMNEKLNKVNMEEAKALTGMLKVKGDIDAKEKELEQKAEIGGREAFGGTNRRKKNE